MPIAAPMQIRKVGTTTYHLRSTIRTAPQKSMRIPSQVDGGDPNRMSPIWSIGTTNAPRYVPFRVMLEELA
ncbi:hypothetical protein Pmi06nite_40320 [Planotetraspora mira]|uniref:Uncharacterized protein n=1 Tax=Planotetraspora mira TaxID=58121 RepID=A0A8J3X7G7_9ACTN|nr:hypothetical protein Pmi06nite_40320 [Planotetraspora mira]